MKKQRKMQQRKDAAGLDSGLGAAAAPVPPASAARGQRRESGDCAAASLNAEKKSASDSSSSSSGGGQTVKVGNPPTGAAIAGAADSVLEEQQQMRDSELALDADDAQVDEALKRLVDTMDQLEEACGADYTFIGDNIDFLVKIVGSTKAKRNKLYHWFHLIGMSCLTNCLSTATLSMQCTVSCHVLAATKNRVTPPSNLRDDVASGNMADWTFLGTLPSPDDMTFMKHMFVVLVGRISSARMKWMKDYDMQRDCVVDEVKHEYADEMRKKSSEVGKLSVGMILMLI